MMGRAEVADILIHEGVHELAAWHIVMDIKPEYLEAMDESAVRRDLDNILWSYLERTGALEPDRVAPA